MIKSKTMERLMRLCITLLGAGAAAGVAALITPILRQAYPGFMKQAYALLAVYGGLCFLGALFFFLISSFLIQRTMQLVSSVERRWDRMPVQQILMGTTGLILGLLVAFLATQLVLSAGASLLTISFSALVYLILGMIGMQIGSRRYREGNKLARRMRRRMRAGGDSGLLEDDALFPDDEEDGALGQDLGDGALPKKFLDTSVIIDGRVLDIVKTGFLEGDIVIPQFVLAELRHIADSGDSLRRARGRRGLDVLNKLQKELKNPIIVDETDYDDIAEVDVKLLRLCRDRGGIVVTNDYNLNKVAGVTGIKVLNINDLANAVKPMLMAGEELNVQIVREGKEPGQGVAYLDDGTMIVVDNGRRYVGETASVVVTTVLQTSAGRMIFTKLKNADEKAG